MLEAKDEFTISEIVGNNVSSKTVLTILVGIGSVSQDAFDDCLIIFTTSSDDIGVKQVNDWPVNFLSVCSDVSGLSRSDANV